MLEYQSKRQAIWLYRQLLDNTNPRRVDPIKRLTAHENVVQARHKFNNLMHREHIDAKLYKNNPRHLSKTSIKFSSAKKKVYYFRSTFRRIIRNTPSCSL